MQQVQNAVKENVKKITGDGKPSGESKENIETTQENAQANTLSESNTNEEGVNENISSDNGDSGSNNNFRYDESLDELKKVKKVVKSEVVKEDEEEDLDFDFNIKPLKENNEVKPIAGKKPKKSMLDIAKKIEKKAREESKRKEYKKVNYLRVGRGLAYNCKEKYWACLNKSEYFNCRDNKEHLELNKKPKECFPLEVYSSIRDCKIIQIHNINTLKKQIFARANNMVIVDESLSQEIRKYIETSCENVKSLSDFDALIPSNVFNVILVDQKNLSSVHSKMHRPESTFFFIFWQGDKISEDDLMDMEFYTFINKTLSIDGIKKQLEIFVKENPVLEKVQFSLNKRFKAELEERATFLRSIESKLSDVHKNLVPLRKAIAPNMKLFPSML